MRDLRDPQEMGTIYLRLRQKAAFTIEEAVVASAPNFKGNETCIERYGSANDVKPKWMEVQVK